MTDIRLGDCLDVLRTMPDCSIDAVVTDPPYGLSFMGKKWDYDVPTVEVWREVFRVLKPGGHLLAFAGTRTQHRMCVNIEDAGFEIRDMIAWVYGSGFPKSLDVSKALDKAAGAEREVVGRYSDNGRKCPKHQNTHATWEGDAMVDITAPATEAANQWSGWGTALKPAMEPITVARKPLDGTVAENVLRHGTGAINVDGCRVGTGDRRMCGTTDKSGKTSIVLGARQETRTELGRWPANLIHDGSDEVLGLFPADARSSCDGGRSQNACIGYSGGWKSAYDGSANQYFDTGSAARFFYTAKAAKRERQGVTHPTVKPLDLMAYLCRLVTPPGGIVLDPFMGTGTTIKAAIGEGFQAIGIERDPAYFAMAEHRLNGAQLGLGLEVQP